MTIEFSMRRFSANRFLTNHCSRLLRVSSLALLFLPQFIFAQGSPSERVYQKSESDVHKALQQLHSSLGGRLPILDGFVDTEHALDNYSRGYYQCSVQITPASSGGTLVKVTAKITAWYAESSSAPGAYRVLPSNGRLEADFLDHLDDSFGGTASAQTSPAAPAIAVPARATPTPPPAAVREPNAPTLPHSSKPDLLATAPPTPLPGGLVIPPYSPAHTIPSSSAGDDLMSPKEKREEAEQRKQLIADIRSLEEIQSNQVHPTNLAVVKLPGTPVLALPATTATTIVRADAGDEFEVLDKQEHWVHVRIADQSSGWIKTTALDLSGVAEPAPSTVALNRSKAPAFYISREETRPFPGDWEPLHGKTVRIIWVEPTSEVAGSSAGEKLSFAKSVFSKADQELASANQSVAGVVIVFDSADGGQISATLSSLRQWRAGSLSEASFWKRCALDPSDFLQDASKTSGGNL
jgi:hypothetical protein